MHFTKTPSLAKFFFKDVVWNFSSREKNIYLTFDDGPTPDITEQTLEILKNHKAKATFFCVGKNIERHEKLYRKIIAHKHSIGNHTYSHLNGWKTSINEYLDDVKKCEEVIKLSTINDQLPTNLFRPPYGKISPSQYSILNTQYSIIMWDVMSGDFAYSGKTCLSNVIKNAYDGSIVVFHDSVKAHKSMLYALPKVLDYFSEKGFRFEKIQPLLNPPL